MRCGFDNIFMSTPKIAGPYQPNPALAIKAITT
jgi:hypothetical protein